MNLNLTNPELKSKPSVIFTILDNKDNHVTIKAFRAFCNLNCSNRYETLHLVDCEWEDDREEPNDLHKTYISLDDHAEPTDLIRKSNQKEELKKAIQKTQCIK